MPPPRTLDSFPAICTRSSCASWRNHPGRPHNDSGKAAPCYRSTGLQAGLQPPASTGVQGNAPTSKQVSRQPSRVHPLSRAEQAGYFCNRLLQGQQRPEHEPQHRPGSPAHCQPVAQGARGIGKGLHGYRDDGHPDKKAEPAQPAPVGTVPSVPRHPVVRKRKQQGKRRSPDTVCIRLWPEGQIHGDQQGQGTDKDVDHGGMKLLRTAHRDQSESATSLCGTSRVGPLAFGRISKSKISVGNASVQHAFGMSTIPLIRPSTGAVPRIM